MTPLLWVLVGLAIGMPVGVIGGVFIGAMHPTLPRKAERFVDEKLEPEIDKLMRKIREKGL